MIQTCYAKQVSNWDLVAETATRIYVHETLTLLSDYNLDGVFDTERSEATLTFMSLAATTTRAM